MEDSTFNYLFESLKILEEQLITIPIFGKQKLYTATKYDDIKEEFKLIINRKGHLNSDKLTYQLTSRHGILIRLDMDGSPHENSNGELIETPHIHIFSSEYNYGKKAIPLSDITNQELVEDIFSSLVFFLSYNNIQEPDINTDLI